MDEGTQSPREEPGTSPLQDREGAPVEQEPQSALDEEVFNPRADMQAKLDASRNRNAAHTLALLRQGALLSTAQLARAAAVTVDLEQIRLDGVDGQVAELEDRVKLMDRIILKLSLQVHIFLRERQARRGLPALADFRDWLRGLPGIESWPHATLSDYLEEDEH